MKKAGLLTRAEALRQQTKGTTAYTGISKAETRKILEATLAQMAQNRITQGK